MDKFQWVLTFLGMLIPADLYVLYQILIVLLSFGFISVVLYSTYKNRGSITFSHLLTREDGRISKVGISFIFVQILIIYQVLSGAKVDSYLVELLAVIFGAELGTKYIAKIPHPKEHRTGKNCPPDLADDDLKDI